MNKTQNENDLIELTLQMHRKGIELSAIQSGDTLDEVEEILEEMLKLEDGIEAATLRVKAEREAL